MPWSAERYTELEETNLVLTPLHTTTILQPEHFSTPLQQLRYPVKLDFSHERFRLRSLALLSQLKDTALQDIDLSDNELRSLAELSRFSALKTLCARRNALSSGPGVHLAVHRLTRLDVSDNQLSELPPLKELPLLQVLNVSRNQIRDGWHELQHCTGLQALDASSNQLGWEPESGELQRAMAVLRGLKRLRVLNLSQNPVATQQRAYRAWVLANARRLEVFDNAGVSEAEREGEDVMSRVVDATMASQAHAPRSRARHDGGTTAAEAAAAAAAGGGSKPQTARVFGVPLQQLLQQELSSLPRVVQECTRHVQERAPQDKSALTVDADPSLMLQLRKAFERSPEAGQRALLTCMDAAPRGSGEYADVRAACSLVRSFLIELPQPLVPVELFLPLLEAAQLGPTSADKPLGAQLEAILVPMAHEQWALLEHLLCFLVNASRAFDGHDQAFRQLLARVWAPCILRAPARTMSQFHGKVIDAMARALLGLLDLRRAETASPAAVPAPAGGNAGGAGPSTEEDPEAAAEHAHAKDERTRHHAPASPAPSSPLRSSLAPSSPARSPARSPLESHPPVGGEPPPPSPGARKRTALLDSLEELQEEAVQHTAVGADNDLLINLSTDEPTKEASPLPDAADAVLRQQRATADELLSTLADLRDDCSLLDEEMPITSQPPPPPMLPPPAASTLQTPAGHQLPAQQAAFLQPPSASLAQAVASLAAYPPVQQQAVPHPGELYAQHAREYHQHHPTFPHSAVPMPYHPAGGPHGGMSSWRDDACSHASAMSSHRMASAAAAALESREAEASKLKQKAQRLLRSRSELACDLEGLQEALSRVERAAARTREQAHAMAADSSRHSTSDTRRHTAQVSTLSKAVLREKQRRLAARNELGALQRQLIKKRALHSQLAKRVEGLEEADAAARARVARAESAVEGAQQLRELLQQRARELTAARAEGRARLASNSEAAVPLHAQQRLLEGRLSGLRQAIAQQRSLEPRAPLAPGKSRLSSAQRGGSGARATAARERAKLLEALEVERDQAAPATSRRPTGEWAQLAERLQALLPRGDAGDFTSREMLAEAAKWHAEARAFAAEARRVERLHQQAVAKREAEREGWRDFQEELRKGRSGTILSNEEAQLDALRQELMRVQTESDELLHGEGPMRTALQAEGLRLQKLRALAAELGASLG